MRGITEPGNHVRGSESRVTEEKVAVPDLIPSQPLESISVGKNEFQTIGKLPLLPATVDSLEVE